jgi:two-component system phosphate regulon response regulator PhoB
VSHRILIVEDERDLADTLAYNLEQEGYQAVVANDGQTALDILADPPAPDLVLLDLMLPDLPGEDVCRQIRSDPATRSAAVIMLTAKGDEIDRVVGFELGADDYVVKPFSVRELLLRIKAVLRRNQPPPAEDLDELTFGRLRISVSAHRVWVDVEEVFLTALEFRLLTNLLERKGRVQSRDVLLADVWGIEADVTTRTVDTHIKRLREKLGQAAGYIETIRGVGYRFRTRPDD